MSSKSLHSAKPASSAKHATAAAKQHAGPKHAVVPGGITAVAPIMHMGCTAKTITYRAAGMETVCLQAPDRGVQQLAGFNAAAGDVIGLDGVLDRTLARTDLSDVGNWITSTQSAAGTTLYFDATGTGQQGLPFAVLQGVDTTVAQLVADGGMKYIPDAIEVAATFTPTFTLRASGMETVDVQPVKTGIAAQTLIGFNPDNADVLQLAGVLNSTNANPDLSDVAGYITARVVNGNTVLSVDSTGAGGAGTPFVVLQGISVTVSQLLADGALAYTPTETRLFATENNDFTCRPAGLVEVVLLNHGAGNAPVVQGFSPAAGDSVDVGQLLFGAGISATVDTASDYFSTTQSAGSTTLWFNAAGTATNNPPGSGIAELVLQNTLTSLSSLLGGGALMLTGNGASELGGKLMRMGCTGVPITYRDAGNEIVCLQSAVHGEQVINNFSAAAGDVLGVDDILEQTPALANLSDAAAYITSTVTNGSTTLYFDPTGSGQQGTPFALLQGVSTTVAALIADGGMQYIPDAIEAAPVFGTLYTFRPSGLTTLDLAAPVPGASAQQIAGFNPNLADILEISKVLDPTTAAPDLSNVVNYITATQSAGNTILSVDDTGTGQAGTPFAVLQGVTVTVAQLMAANALSFTPTPTHVVAGAGATLSFRPEGQETAVVGIATAHLAAPVLNGFSLAGGDLLDIANVPGASGLLPDMSNAAAFIATKQVGADTQLWIDPAGKNPLGGHEFADLHDTRVTLSQLLNAHALVLT